MQQNYRLSLWILCWTTIANSTNNNLLDLTHYTTIKWNRSSSSQSASTQTLTINCPSGSEDEYALTGVKFSDKSKAFANNTYASSIDYYYTPQLLVIQKN